MPPDHDLLHEWLVAHDEAALAQLIARHRPMIYSTAWRLLRDKDQAEDVVQETFIELANQAGKITETVEGWLRVVASNRALKMLRLQGRRRARDSRAALESSPAEVDDSPLLDDIAECIAKLTPGERELIVRIFWDGHTQKEIASLSRVSAVTIHKRVRASLDSLRHMLRQRGVRIAMTTLLLMMSRLSGSKTAATGWILARPITPSLGGSPLAVAAMMAGGLAVSALLVLAMSGPTAGSATGASAGKPIVGGAEATTPAPDPLPPTSGPTPTRNNPPKTPVQLSIPAFCRQVVDDGWRPTDPATWTYQRHQDGERDSELRIGDPGLALFQDGADPILRFLPAQEQDLIAIVPVPAKNAAGFQIRVDQRVEALGPWHPVIYTTVRSSVPPADDVISITTRDGADLSPTDRLLHLPMHEKRRVSPLFRQDGDDFHAFITIAPWKRTLASMYTDSVLPIMTTSGCDIRRAHIRILTASERQEIISLVERRLSAQADF